jgi:methionine sulfoxide reductase heme-binding subunit
MTIKQQQRLLKVGVGVAAMVPVSVITYRFLTNALGANPIAEALNMLGLWTLILLLCCLACTPLKIITGWNWTLWPKKLLGLLAFFYACLHLLTYVGLDQFFAWGEIGKDIVKRKFITVGMAAFTLLVPLAVTSTKGMVKRLGFPRWKRLHRLIYVAGVLGVIHFMWRVKGEQNEPLIYGGVLILLLAIRVVAHLRTRTHAAVKTS